MVDIYTTDQKFQVVYADPPWRYKNKESIAKSSCLNGTNDVVYPTMSLDEICVLPVPRICDDNTMLFLWVVSPMLPGGLTVMRAWGFKFATVAFVWEKQRINPGHYTMSSCELCLAGRRGKIPTPQGARNIRQFVSEKKTAHSAKPAEIRERIAKMFPTQQRIELFARNLASGWWAWGNEV